MAERKGRPTVDPAGGPSTNLRVRIPVVDYDRLYVKAREARTSVTVYARQTFRKAATSKP